jgi:hypothetical protein
VSGHVFRRAASFGMRFRRDERPSRMAQTYVALHPMGAKSEIIVLIGTAEAEP